MSSDNAPTAPMTGDPIIVPTRRRRIPTTRWVLVGLILATAGFAGGVLEAQHARVTAGGGPGAAGRAASRTATGGSLGGGATNSGNGDTTVGTVLMVDGPTVYLTTANGSVVKVSTDGKTQIAVSATGTARDLKAGASIVVQGAPNAAGDIAATSITGGAAPPAAAASGS